MVSETNSQLMPIRILFSRRPISMGTQARLIGKGHAATWGASGRALLLSCWKRLHCFSCFLFNPLKSRRTTFIPPLVHQRFAASDFLWSEFYLCPPYYQRCSSVVVYACAVEIGKSCCSFIKAATSNFGFTEVRKNISCCWRRFLALSSCLFSVKKLLPSLPLEFLSNTSVPFQCPPIE